MPPAAPVIMATRADAAAILLVRRHLTSSFRMGVLCCSSYTSCFDILISEDCSSSRLRTPNRGGESTPASKFHEAGYPGWYFCRSLLQIRLEKVSHRTRLYGTGVVPACTPRACNSSSWRAAKYKVRCNIRLAQPSYLQPPTIFLWKMRSHCCKVHHL